MEPKPKPFWKSKFLWGFFLTILQIFLKKQGIDIPDGENDIGQYVTGLFAAYGLRDAMPGGLKTMTIIFGMFIFSSCASSNQTQSSPLGFEWGIDKTESHTDSTIVYLYAKAKDITPKSIGIISEKFSKGKVVVYQTTFDETGLGTKIRITIVK